MIMSLYGLLALSATFIAVRHLLRGSIHFLPTLGWCFLMLIPFVMQYPLFYPETRGYHGMVVATLTVIILCADMIAQKTVPQPAGFTPSKASLRIGYGLSIFYVALTVLHFATAHSIPFFDAVESGYVNNDTLNARIDFLRNYNAIPGIKYLFSMSTAIIGMPAVLLLWLHRRRFMALSLFFWILFYCVASTAKGPLILTLVITAAGLIFTAHDQKRIKMGRAFLGLALAGILTIAAITLNPASHTSIFTVFSHLDKKYGEPEMFRDDRKKLLGDYVRPRLDMPIDSCTNRICRNADYLAYRIFITPIEVSARWYEYFTAFPVKEISFSRNIHDSRSGTDRHPAQAVGIWAFAEPYPHAYSDATYAYPSMDADAFGRFGWRGLVALMLAYFGLRLATIYFNDTRAVTGGVFYAVLVSLFAFLPPNAGIQAIILAQGVGGGIAVLCALRAWPRLRRRYGPSA